MQGEYCVLLGEEDASGDPGSSEFGVELPEVEDKGAVSSSASDEFVMMMVSNRLDEGFGKPHLQHSHGNSDLPRSERKDALMPTQSAWYHVSHDSHSMLDLAPL